MSRLRRRHAALIAFTIILMLSLAAYRFMITMPFIFRRHITNGEGE